MNSQPTERAHRREMSETTAISTLLPLAGSRSVKAVPDRTAPAQREDGPQALTPDRAARGPDAAAAPHGPLLSPSTQLAAQQRGRSVDDAPAKASEAAASKNPADTESLSDAEQQKVRALQQRDREVRAHEQAHKAAGGRYAGNPTFETVRGPDGRSYAVSGEVKIDTSGVPNNPDATIRKLEQVKRAALAPSDPSAQDRRVAAEADAKIQKARQEKQKLEAEELEKAKDKNANGDDPAGSAQSGPPLAGAASPRSGTPYGPTSAPPVSPGSLFNLVA